MTTLTKLSIRLERAIIEACAPKGDRERGDVPGWVLITLMTAGIVAVLWTVAEDQLTSLFERAIAKVSNR